MPERSFDNFDDFAKDYRAIHTANVKLSGADSFYFAEHKVLQVKENEKQPSLRMLDIGCGDGATELYISKYFPGWNVEGIDISENSIASAKARGLRTANFRVYDGRTLPFTAESFDIVFIAAVLHHIDFTLHDIIIGQVLKVLKPGGRLYLFEHNPLNPLTRHLVKTCVFDKDAKLLGYNYTARLLSANGFSSISKKFLLFFPRKGVLANFIPLEKHLGWLTLGGQYMFRAVK